METNSIKAAQEELKAARAYLAGAWSLYCDDLLDDEQYAEAHDKASERIRKAQAELEG